MFLNKKYEIFSFSLTAFSILLLTVFAVDKYQGSAVIYLLFTLVSNLLLYAGFTKQPIFFDTFLGIFFWLGFWLKLTIRVVFFDSSFGESARYFAESASAFDKGLLVSTCGLFGFLLASLVRRKFFNYNKKNNASDYLGLFTVYNRHKKVFLYFYIFIFLFVSITNLNYGIYQKGSITITTLPFGLGGIYKWLLLFGLSSFSALIIHFEMKNKNSIPQLVMIISLIESFFSNISLLSRGMILNASAIIYGVMASLSKSLVKKRIKFLAITLSFFIILFCSSIFIVNYIRVGHYLDYSGNKTHEIKQMTTPLFLDRWVGIEAVYAVSSFPRLDWSLFKAAIKEKYNENETSFYDNFFINSPYVDTDKSKHHFVSMPGFIAFFFYPGSFLFLLACTFLIGLLGAFVEFFTYKFGGGNLVLCALIAQVFAYRLSNFGYVPAQSYLLLGSIFINIFFFYALNKICSYYRFGRFKNRL